MLFPWKLKVPLKGIVTLDIVADADITQIFSFRINYLKALVAAASAFDQPYRGTLTLGTYYSSFVVSRTKFNVSIRDFGTSGDNVQYWIALTPIGLSTNPIGLPTTNQVDILEYPGTSYRIVGSGRSQRAERPLIRAFNMKPIDPYWDARNTSNQGGVSNVAVTDPVTSPYVQLSFGHNTAGLALGNYNIRVELTAYTTFFDRRVQELL